MPATALNAQADTARCPLCHQPNQCAIAAGRPAQECWCMHEDVCAQALERLPQQAREPSCICPHCAREPSPAHGASTPPGAPTDIIAAP
ncbi:cysteine-rich CWC family protein [Diaphorobacter sp.]|uniref:cysteine-rich CWC family protein n=1 Tax=Diaphorobacter sp. TaxID=1934310 RepID=UPI003D0B2ABF